MQVKGREYELLSNALINAFGFDSLEAMLEYGLGVRLDRIVGRGTDIDAAVFQLIAEYNRRDQIEKLVQAARRFNPTNSQLHEVAQSLGWATQVSTHIGDKETPVAPDGLEKLVRRRVLQLPAKETRDQMMRVEGQMCIVERKMGEGRGQALGSGFLIGPDTVLTNYHVVRQYLSGSQAQNLQVRFDASPSKVREREAGDGVIFAVEEIPANRPYTKGDALNLNGAPADDELDFAILVLAEDAGSAQVGGVIGGGQEQVQRGWIKMPDPDPAFEPGDPLIIYQYPCGRELMMAIDTEAVVETAWEGRRVRYRNNTEPGSSGSPVFDMKWNLVALHHAGGPSEAPVDYDPCSSFGEDDPERALAEFNQGIPIANIHAYIKSLKLDYLLGD